MSNDELFFNGSAEVLDAAGQRKAFLEVAGSLVVAQQEGDLKIFDGPRRITMTASQSDLLVTFPGTAGKFLVIKTSEDLTVKRNSSGGEAWPVNKWKSTMPGGCMIATSFTSLYLTNLAAREAVVEILMAGN
jgi:hypothetical protein